MTIKNIDCQTLKDWLDRDEAVVIDVREIDEYQKSNISLAQLIPLGTICKDLLPKAHHKKIVIHCHAGKRSLMACEKLLQEDPNLELYNLEGGICAWINLAGK